MAGHDTPEFLDLAPAAAPFGDRLKERPQEHGVPRRVLNMQRVASLAICDTMMFFSALGEPRQPFIDQQYLAPGRMAGRHGMSDACLTLFRGGPMMMMKFCTNVLRILTAGVLFTLAGFASAQQSYPHKPIRLIVPNPPAGSTDILARLVGQRLMDSWGQQVIIDNRPGANGMIGTEITARAIPDGYTILLVNLTHVINSVLVAKLPYDGVKDFAPIATLTISQFLMAINPTVPANNVREFIALAKSSPGKLNYATSGYGAVSHLAAERFSTIAGVKMQHIPYKGAGPALTDLIAGLVDVYFATTISTMPHIKSGKIKAIATSGEKRLSVLPQLPTFGESGLPDCCAKNWFGIVAPAGTAKAIIDKMSAEIAAALAMPTTKATLASQGVEPFVSTPEQFLALIRNDKDRIAEIVKAANIKPN